MKLGIVISMFPEAHETFILRELTELDAQGLEYEIFSLQFPRDPVTHPDAKRLQERTHYGHLLGMSALGAFFRTLLRHPLRLLRCIATLISCGWREPAELCKSLGILPLTLHFGEVMRARGIHHTHGHWRNVPTTACWILEMIEGIPWSAAIHGENIFTGSRLIARKLADARFIAVCNGYSHKYLQTQMNLPRPGDIHLNYHGLEPSIWDAVEDARAKTSLTHTRKTILTAGRLVTFKGHDVLLRALHHLCDKGLDVQLRLIGCGPEEENLRALTRELNIDDRVTFLGLLPFADVLGEMAACDAFALASVMDPDGSMDGIPNVLAEAMAFQKPVVSTTVSGIPELVRHEDTGLLVEPHDDDGLAEALYRLLTDEDLCRRLGPAARAHVQAMFDLRGNIRELMELFGRYVETPAEKTQ